MNGPESRTTGRDLKFRWELDRSGVKGLEEFRPTLHVDKGLNVCRIFLWQTELAIVIPALAYSRM